MCRTKVAATHKNFLNLFNDCFLLRPRNIFFDLSSRKNAKEERKRKREKIKENNRKHQREATS